MPKRSEKKKETIMITNTDTNSDTNTDTNIVTNTDALQVFIKSLTVGHNLLYHDFAMSLSLRNHHCHSKRK